MKQKRKTLCLRTAFGLLCLLSLAVGTAAAAKTYTYDGLNRLKTVTYEDKSTVTYHYDAGGNITHITKSGADEEKGEAGKTEDGEKEEEKKEEGGSGQSLAEFLQSGALQQLFQKQLKEQLELLQKNPEELLRAIREAKAGFAFLWKLFLG